jgi:uncharacterized protein YndB with AHSA1/START domain
VVEEPRSPDELEMSGRAEVWIAVAPAVAYAAVTDLPRMGEWSPENCGGERIDSPTADRVGATFRGRNRGPQGEWETICTVVEAEPATRFAFCVALPGDLGTTWRYSFRPNGRGTVVTEAFEWHWSPTPDEGFRGRVGRLPLDEAKAAVADRQEHLRKGVHATLAALKQALENASGST